MAARRYQLSRRARADLDSIAGYLRERNPDAARSVLMTLRSTFELLADNPGSGTQRDDLHPSVRLYTPPRPARNYVVFFYPRPNGVEISDIISCGPGLGRHVRPRRTIARAPVTPPQSAPAPAARS